LLEVGLIVEARKGARPNKASLYGLTFFDLDFCDGKLDITPSQFRRGAWRLYGPPPPLKPTGTPRAIAGENVVLTTPREVEVS